MFTGIVTAMGEVEAIERRNGLMRLTVASPYDAAGVEIGASSTPGGGRCPRRLAMSACTAGSPSRRLRIGTSGPSGTPASRA
jgi:riboflavin synthase